MRILKKAAALFMSVVLTVSFTGCGTKRNGNAKALDIDKEVSVCIWYNDESYTSYLEYIAEEFHKANEFVTINTVLIEKGDILDAVYEGSISNDDVADVYLMPASDIQKAYLSGLISENDKYTSSYSTKHFPVSAINAACYGGKLYGYPVTFSAAVMVYNKKYVSEPETMEQIEEYINSYKVTDTEEKLTMIAGWDSSDLMINYAFGGSYVDAGGETGEENTAVIQEESLKASMTQYAALKKTFGLEKNRTQQDYIDLFSQSKVLYTIIESDNLSQINKSGVDYGICNIPGAKTGFGTQSLSETTLAAVNPYSENIGTAKAVAQAISYDYADLLEEYTGHISARNDVTKKKYHEQYKKLYEVYAGSDIRAKYMGADEFYLRYDIMLNEVWEGTDVSDAFNTFNQAVK